jgi:dienelactone hydrolase
MNATLLAGYDDLPAFLGGAAAPRFEAPAQQQLADVLGLRRVHATDVRVERTWERDGVRGHELSWFVGFGPRTRAFLLEPVAVGSYPGLLGMHCHGGVRSTGAEQLVETDRPPHPSAARLRDDVYDGAAVANDLARDGFVVLVHDTFSWGSRAFDLSAPEGSLAFTAEALDARWRERGDNPTDHERFDALATAHEHLLAKALGVLGTSLAGVVTADDLAALEVLAAWESVDADRLGTFGLSGGGGRAMLTSALDDRVRATVVTCMMATSSSLVPDYIDGHSWLLHSPGLPRAFDWPAVTGIGRERDVLVQYARQYRLFPMTGMTDADTALRAMHQPGRYRGEFFDADHRSTAEMQRGARAFFGEVLASAL